MGVRRGVLVGVVGVSVLVGACSSSGGGGGGSEPGVSSSEVVVGDTVALTGDFAVVTGPYLAGVRSAMDRVNAAGGVFGRKVVFDAVDDGLDTAQAVTGARKFASGGEILAAAFPFGTAATVAKSPIYARADVPYFQLGLSRIDQSKAPEEFGCMPPYFSQVQTPIKYAAQTLGGKKFGVIVTNDSAGADVTAGAEQALTAVGLKPTAVVTYATGATDYSGQLNELKDDDFIIAHGSTPDLARIVIAAQRVGIHARFIGGLPMGDPTFLSLAKGAAEGALIGSPLLPLSSNTKGMRQFQADLKKYGGKADQPTLWALAGYHCSNVLIKGLQNAGKDLTRQTLVTGLESIHNYDDGVAPPVTYSKTQHTAEDSPIALLQIKNNTYIEITAQ